MLTVTPSLTQMAKPRILSKGKGGTPVSPSTKPQTPEVTQAKQD